MSEGKLPEGWNGCNLGEIIDVHSGIGFPIKYQGKSSGDYPVFKVRDISLAVAKRKGKLNDAGHYISAEEVIELKGKIFRPGTTVFAKIGEAVKLNRRAIVQVPGLVDNNVMAISAIVHEMDEFLFHFMNTIDLSKQTRATTIPSIRKGDIENIILSLPPLAEQKIIAEKLDTLLAQVDSTKARLEQIPKILKRFRQAVLSHFVISDLQEPKIKLVELTSKIGSGSTPKGGNDNYKIDGIPFVRSLNIHTHFIKHEDLAYIDKEQAKKLNNVIIHEKDVLLNITGASIGRVNIAPDNFVGGRVNQHVAIIRCQQSKILPEYLHVYMASPHIQKWIQGENYGATRQALTKKMLEELPIIVPSVKKQDEIVRRVEQLFAYAESIEKQVNNALACVNNLTQSILAKAFRGELTAQWRVENPELISGENSAAALLEKIKAERAARAGKKATRKKS